MTRDGRDQTIITPLVENSHLVLNTNRLMERGGITSPKEKRSETSPDRGEVPMFAEDISGVEIAMHVMNTCNPSGHDLMYLMIREGIMALMKLGVRDGGSVDDRFIVTEHHGLTVNGYAKVAEGKPLIHDLVATSTTSHIFTAEGCGLHGRLEFGVPVNGSLVPEV